MDAYQKIIKLAAEVKKEISTLAEKNSHTEFFKLLENISGENHDFTYNQLKNISNELEEISKLAKEQIKSEKANILRLRKFNVQHTKYITNQGLTS